MKKIISVLIVFCAMLVSVKGMAADSPSNVWTYPTLFNYDEEVTWYFDLSGTTVQEGVDLYLWAWQPSEPDAGNFANSSDFAKLEYEGNMIWKKTLIPTQYFKVTVDQIWNHTETAFYMLLKTKDGGYATGTVAIAFPHLFFNTFKSSGKDVQIVTNIYKDSEAKSDVLEDKFYIDEPLTMLVNADLLWSGGVQGFTGEELHLHAGLNNFDTNAFAEYQAWIPEVSEKTRLRKVKDNIYKLDMVPRTYFGPNNIPPLADDYVMENIEFLFPAKDWTKVYAGKDGNIIIYAPDAPIPPDPVFYFFPQKFSQYDILTMVRTNNEKGSQGLEYTLTAGSKVITGEFTGSLTEMRAYVDLLTQLSGLGELTKVNLEVKDKNGKEIIKTDIPLVPVSELE